MAIDIAVVPVAGQGTRLLPLTKSQPKEMLPVGRKPGVQYVIEELAQSGISKVILVTGPGKTSIENHFDINSQLIQQLRETGKEKLLAELGFERKPIEYFYTRQRRQLGLGHAVLHARGVIINQPFVVALGDSIIGMHAQSDIVARMVKEFERSNADAVIAFETVPPEDVVNYGIAEPSGGADRVFTLASIVEKPSVEAAPSNLAVAARYVFSPEIFEHLAATRPGKGGEIQLTDAIQALIQRGGRVLGVQVAESERRFDIGNLESYFKAFVEFALADEEYGPELGRHLRTLL